MPNKNIDVYVRKGTLEDVPAVTALWRSLVGTEGCAWDEYYPGEVQARDDVEQGWLYVLCKDDGEIIGAMASGDADELWEYDFWNPEIKHRCCFSRLGIAAEYQFRGFAKFMISEAERDAVRRGYDGVGFLVSPTNQKALNAYRKMNYDKVGECTHYEEDWFCYEKKLEYKNPSITTYSGIRMNPVEPKLQDISIKDIAHALSLVCRGGGHVKHFYSVAQHSLVCAEEAVLRGCSLRVQMGALLHDGSEAYMSDLVRPVKEQIPQYRIIENRLIDIIWQRFIPGLPLNEEERRLIKEIDDDAMSWDMKILLGEEINQNYEKLQVLPQHAFLPMDEVEAVFLTKFEKLTEELRLE